MGLVVLVLTFLCLRMAWRGWRGVRVGSEWRCRRCEFDLTGRREGDVRCPECGAQVARVGGTVRGHRVRSRPKIVIGLVTAALLLSPVIAGIAGRKVNWRGMEPLWILRWEFNHSGVVQQHAAGLELAARATRSASKTQLLALVDLLLQRADRDDQGSVIAEDLVGSLNKPGAAPEVRSAVLQWALNRHEDLSKPFSTLLGDFIEEAYWAGELDQARFATLGTAVQPPCFRPTRRWN